MDELLSPRIYPIKELDVVKVLVKVGVVEVCVLDSFIILEQDRFREPVCQEKWELGEREISELRNKLAVARNEGSALRDLLQERGKHDRQIGNERAGQAELACGLCSSGAQVFEVACLRN